MKKSVFIVLIILLSLTSCSKDSSDSLVFNSFLEEWGLLNYQEGVCASVTDAIELGEPEGSKIVWDMISDETVHSMSTCGLLETILNYRTIRIFGPWCEICSNLDYPGITMFNNSLRANKVAVELFTRDDCFPVLTSKYLTMIEKKEPTVGHTSYFEMLLTSDMYTSTLNDSEKIMVMAMALERTKQFKSEVILINETLHILAVMMRTFNYSPFLNEVGTEWREYIDGYTICSTNKDLIIKYAKQFLKEQK